MKIKCIRCRRYRRRKGDGWELKTECTALNVKVRQTRKRYKKKQRNCGNIEQRK